MVSLFCFKRADKPRTTTLTTLLSSADSVKIGGSVTFKCETDANPPAHVFKLYHEGSLITQNASFTIDKVKRSNAGKYKCVPSNILGEGGSASIDLTVLGKCRRSIH